MLVHTYDPVSGIYLGPYICQEDPLEEGSFIAPTYYAMAEPPPAGEGQAAFYNWDTKEWEIDRNPRPTAAEKLAINIEAYRLAARVYMTTVAQEQPEKFNSISEAKSYAGTPNEFEVISKAMIVWAASVHTAVNTILADVESGAIELPEQEAFIDSLPTWVRPE